MKKYNILINEMLSNCVHLGHRKKFFNKDMKNFIIDNKNEINIINLEKSFIFFIEALKKIKKTIELNKIILFICSKPQLKSIIKMAAKSINMPYMINRWLGGMLTNFRTVKSSVNKMNFLKTKLKKNLKLKKKPTNILKKKLKIMKRKYSGIKNIEKLPDMVFVVDSKKHKNAIIEAKKVGIPVMAIVDTDSSIKNVDYIIPGNDDSFKSIIFYMKYITQVVKQTKEDLIKKNEKIN